MKTNRTQSKNHQQFRINHAPIQWETFQKNKYFWSIKEGCAAAPLPRLADTDGLGTEERENCEVFCCVTCRLAWQPHGPGAAKTQKGAKYCKNHVEICIFLDNLAASSSRLVKMHSTNVKLVSKIANRD